MGNDIGYIRVSTDKQNLNLQEDALNSSGCSRIFRDIASGSKCSRPGLEACLDYLREDDTLVVWRSDRLGRSTIELLKIVDSLRERKINFKSLTEDLFDTTTSNGRLVFGIFALLAEHEKDRLRERTKAGLKAAKARGRLGGRPKSLTPEKEKIASDTLKDPDHNIKEIARALSVSMSTIYRLQRKNKHIMREKLLTQHNNNL